MLKKTIFLGLLLSGAVFQEMSAINFGKFFSRKLTAQQIEERKKYADDLVTAHEARELQAETLRQRKAQCQALTDEITAVDAQLTAGFKNGMTIKTWAALEDRKYSAWEKLEKMTAGRQENILPDTRSAFSKKLAQYSTFEFKKFAALKAKQVKNTLSKPKVLVPCAVVGTGLVGMGLVAYGKDLVNSLLMSYVVLMMSFGK